MTYTQTTTETYKGIKVVTTNTSTDAKPVSKRTTKVYVDGKLVTGQSRYRAMEDILEAPTDAVTWEDVRNF